MLYESCLISQKIRPIDFIVWLVQVIGSFAPLVVELSYSNQAVFRFRPIPYNIL